MEPQKISEMVATELRKVAPGTPLREALDMLISAHSGALIAMGEWEELAPVCNEGFRIDMPFTPQRLFELSKMDGAIILDSACSRILWANVHLVPDPSLPTSETGMRHRAAERTSRQTNCLVLAISQRRNVVNLYRNGLRLTLEDIEVLLAKANQAIQTFQNYRQRLDEMLDRLTLLEFDDLVTLDDLAEVIGRFEMLRRVSREVNRYTLQLGTEGRLVRMQADELNAGVNESYILVLRDYADQPAARRAAVIRDRLSALTAERLLEADVIGAALGVEGADHGEQHVRPRGYRALAQIPALPGSVVGRVVERFGSLPQILRATVEELDAVDGVGDRRARAINSGLIRIRSHISA